MPRKGRRHEVDARIRNIIRTLGIYHDLKRGRVESYPLETGRVEAHQDPTHRGWVVIDRTGSSQHGNGMGGNVDLWRQCEESVEEMKY
jgi:hypothetical protein